MNRYHDEIQDAIAQLGDHLARVQLLARDLAVSRQLDDAAFDPETELAVVCWLEEADDVLGKPLARRRRERPAG